MGNADKNYALVNNELPFFAKVYKKILEASTSYVPGLESIYYNAHNEFTWQSTVLMAPLKSTDDDQTVLTKLRMMADYLDIWIMRRVVNYVRVTYSSASYAMYILCRDARRKSIEELSALLKHKLENDDDARFEGSKSRDRDGIEDLRLNQFSRRYIYHLLARITSFIEKESGKGDSFCHLVDRDSDNPFDIEHIWANQYERYQDQCADKAQFEYIRDNIGGLLLLPADVNRSFQDKDFGQKAPHYAKENLYAASLTPFSYQHQPQFQAFITRYNLPFHAYEQFTHTDQQERRRLVLALCNIIWSPERLSVGGAI